MIGFKKIFGTKKKLAFLHIPKTGGTYIKQFETKTKPVIYPIIDLGHCCVIDSLMKNRIYPLKEGIVETVSLARIKKHYVFSAVRNIFSWLVSYAGHTGGWSAKYIDKNHYDYNNAQKGFDYLVKTIASRDSPWPCKKFIFFQLFCDNSKLVVDSLIRTETLDNDLKELAKDRNIKYQKKQKQRVVKHKDYRLYYNDTLRDLVYETWGRELKLYGYDFDGLNLNSAIIKKVVDKSLKELVKYDWKKNLLFINQKIIK